MFSNSSKFWILAVDQADCSQKLWRLSGSPRTPWPASPAQPVEEEEPEEVYFNVVIEDGCIMEHSPDGNFVALAASRIPNFPALGDEASLSPLPPLVETQTTPRMIEMMKMRRKPS